MATLQQAQGLRMSDDVDFEWDDQKRRSNIAKHGLDFVDAARIFMGDYKN